MLAGAIIAHAAACGTPRAKDAATLPPVALVDTAGATTNLPADLSRAPLTVIVFYADHCPCFSAHEGRLRELQQTYGSRGVKLLLVDSEIEGTAARDAEAVTERHLPPISLDRGARLADALGAEYATFTVVFDAEGRIRYRGGIDSDKNRLSAAPHAYLRDALDDLLAGKEPRVAEGKTLGCALMKR